MPMQRVKVWNLESPRSGKPVANQFVIETEVAEGRMQIFQSYESTIAQIVDHEVTLDRKYWDYSVTTGKYRNIFLDETKAETAKKIKSGEYVLADLND